jgi:hypothetical protein
VGSSLLSFQQRQETLFKTGPLMLVKESTGGTIVEGLPLMEHDQPIRDLLQFSQLCWLLMISSEKNASLPLQLPGHVTPESHMKSR